MSRLNYRFSNLCGTVYRQGNMVYSPDGNTLYSAVGNRVASFDLVQSRSFTFPFEARMNITRLVLSPDGEIMLTIDEEGHMLMVNVSRRVVLHHLNLKSKVRQLHHSDLAARIEAQHTNLAHHSLTSSRRRRSSFRGLISTSI